MEVINAENPYLINVSLFVSNISGNDEVIRENYIIVSTDGCPQSFFLGNQEYSTILIDNQCWMQENLNLDKGTNWCYDNNPSNCEIYGRLYKWQSAIDVCPQGWHLPSKTEWDDLSDYFGGSSVSGGALKEEGTVHWNPPNTAATNISGFTGLPGGHRVTSGAFIKLNLRGDFWSSTSVASGAYYREMLYDSDNFQSTYLGQSSGLSVRCMKD